MKTKTSFSDCCAGNIFKLQEPKAPRGWGGCALALAATYGRDCLIDYADTVMRVQSAMTDKGLLALEDLEDQCQARHECMVRSLWTA